MLYAIGDLHLGLAIQKTMNRFGPVWENHTEKLYNRWNDLVTEHDTVLLLGDTSWAMNREDFLVDFKFLQTLKGKKVIIPGNHDYWWNSTSQLNALDNNITFMKNGHFMYEDYAICGTRGWLCPNDTVFTKADEKIYKREVIRLSLSLQSIASQKIDKIIAIFHYPPQNDKCEPSLLTKNLINCGHSVEKVLYGHLHGKDSFARRLELHARDGLSYQLVSADFLDFTPLLVIPNR